MLYETSLVYKFVRRVFPAVERELSYWRSKASEIPDPELRKQALASLSDKRFHAQGGAIFVLYPGLSSNQRRELLTFIVAYQTISDYLDNLCDRAGVENAQAFQQLHQAMAEALVPGLEGSDYYLFYPYSNDGGYLRELVRACQVALDSPSLALVITTLRHWVGLYSQLQTYKHLSQDEREEAMQNWLRPVADEFKDFFPWEIAAATGSTLGIFFLAALAKSVRLQDSLPVVIETYFPWICAIHILLDYFIDRQEDEANGDLNFIRFYQNDTQTAERLTFIYRTAREKAKKLASPRFHILVLDGLLAMYLSDPKAELRQNKRVSSALLVAGGPFSRLLHWASRLLRQTGIV
ncbi:MAG: tetraprenyl-beta-curcumene synthase family protein [Desulfitobacteriaceae bacterium]